MASTRLDEKVHFEEKKCRFIISSSVKRLSSFLFRRSHYVNAIGLCRQCVASRTIHRTAPSIRRGKIKEKEKGPTHFVPRVSELFTMWFDSFLYLNPSPIKGEETKFLPFPLPPHPIHPSIEFCFFSRPAAATDSIPASVRSFDRSRKKKEEEEERQSWKSFSTEQHNNKQILARWIIQNSIPRIHPNETEGEKMKRPK